MRRTLAGSICSIGVAGDSNAEGARWFSAVGTVAVVVVDASVAELGPVHRRRWVRGAAPAGMWRTEAPRGLDIDLERLPAGVVDPFPS